MTTHSDNVGPPISSPAFSGAPSPSRQAYTPEFPTFHKAVAAAASTFGQRNLAWLAAPVIASYDTVSHYDAAVCPGVKGLVALTIDDAPCRQNASACMTTEVNECLGEFGARATFFLTSEFVPGNEDAVINLLLAGHEVANHCVLECPYIDKEEEMFEQHLVEAESVCEELRFRAQQVRPAGRARPTAITPAAEDESVESPAASSMPVRWFRAPGGVMSSAMSRVVRRLGFTHVLGDCYANDPFISDAEFIVETMLEHAMDGSILIIHMPERGFREYNLIALRLLLAGLRNRGLKAITLSDLHKASKAPVTLPTRTEEMTAWDVFLSMLPSLEEETAAAPAEHLYRSSNIVRGSLSGAACIIGGVCDGVTGILVDPIMGALDDGPEGFLSGVGTGVVGVVAKPVAGVTNGVTQIVGGIAGTVASTTRYFTRGVPSVCVS